MLKVLFLIIGALVAVGAFIYLYQQQFGAITFFALSILFFTLSYQQFVKSNRTTDEKEKKAREP